MQHEAGIELRVDSEDSLGIGKEGEFKTDILNEDELNLLDRELNAVGRSKEFLSMLPQEELAVLLIKWKQADLSEHKELVEQISDL